MKRKDVETSVRKLIGSPWIHQGRSPEAGIDCLGVLLFVAEDLGYIKDFDFHVYRREPDGFTLINELRKHLIEIPVSEALNGDILVLRMAGEKLPRHIGIITKGEREYMLVHALDDTSQRKTIEEPLRKWEKYKTHAFRMGGLEDV